MGQPLSLFGLNPQRKPEYTLGEMLAYNLALALRDDDVALTGANNALPMAACRLAQLTHAPNLTFIGGGGGAVNSLVEPLAPSSCDYSYLAAEAALALPDLIALQGRPGFVTVFFVGGMQVDQYGNCNLSSIGLGRRPAQRGPGAASLPFMARFGRTIIYLAAHTARIFVPKVDFRTGPGFLSGPEDYADAQVNIHTAQGTFPRPAPLTSTGPALVATPLALLDFDPASKRMRLHSLHPGVTVEQVQQNTGFDLFIPADVPTTPIPPPEIVRQIRAFDTERLLHKK
jgi:glutaconate CoA-transferase, subunit B